MSENHNEFNRNERLANNANLNKKSVEIVRKILSKNDVKGSGIKS